MSVFTNTADKNICLMAYHETLPIVMNYRLIIPRFRPLSCIYFRGAIIKCALNLRIKNNVMFT